MKKLPVILASLSLLAASMGPSFAQTTMKTMEATTEVAPTTSVKKTTTSLKQIAQPTTKAMRAEAVDTMKDAIAKAKEVFRTKLAVIKDEQKKSMVENIDTRITTVNENRTSEMTQNLIKLSEIVDRISSKSATAKEEGRNTTILEKNITAARSAITLAQTAVTTQAAKTYTINITTETALKTNVMTTLALFRKDIKAVHQKVVTARDGVRVAALELEKQKNLSVTITPTPSITEEETNQ